nr:photochlorophyllide reductase subunit B [Markhamia cauda-felina]
MLLRILLVFNLSRFEIRNHNRFFGLVSQ